MFVCVDRTNMHAVYRAGGSYCLALREGKTINLSGRVFSCVSVFPKTNDLDGVRCVCEARGSHTSRGRTTSSVLGTGTAHTLQVAFVIECAATDSPW